jgi:mannose-6-phosphate isomerase-like protein (cupin superfamily)
MTESTREATILGPQDGVTIDAVGDRYRFLATGGTTNGKYAVWEAIVAPGGGPPPHIHRREEEGFYVIEGHVTIYVDGRVVPAGPGCFVNMPVGSTHWFRNETDKPAKMLVFVAPSGLEAMFLQTGTAVKHKDDPIRPVGREDIERILSVAPTFGVEIKVPQGHH